MPSERDISKELMHSPLPIGIMLHYLGPTGARDTKGKGALRICTIHASELAQYAPGHCQVRLGR